MDIYDSKGYITVSDEKSFIYHQSFNKGHVQVPSMIVSCLGLSNNAKAVYNYISKHVFEKGQSAFPSISRIAYACDCTEKSAITYLDELVEKGFIIRQSLGKGKNNRYHLVDLNEVNLLKVSEMFWRIAVELQHTFSWKRILKARDVILKALKEEGIRLQDLIAEDQTKELLKQVFIKLMQEEGEIDLSFLPRNKKFLENSRKQLESIPKPPTETSKRSSKIGVNKNHYSVIDVSKWGIPQFREYFYDKYLDATDHPHPRNISKHKGLLQRVINMLDNDKELVKTYIDTFFEIGYEVLTMEYFSTTARIGEIQTYLVNGKKPFFLEKKPRKKKESASVTEGTKYKGISEDKIKDIFGEGV